MQDTLVTEDIGKPLPPLDAANPPRHKPGSRTLAEIIADLTKPLPPRLLKTKRKGNTDITFMTWRTAQRLLDLYAPGWYGHVTHIALSSERVAISYELEIPTSDSGMVTRGACGTDDEEDDAWGDPVTRAEQQAFKRAAARFGLGLYLYDAKPGGR